MGTRCHRMCLGEALVVASALSLAMGCGGKDSESGDGVSGGSLHVALPPDEKLSQLSSSDALAACKAAADATMRVAADPSIVRFECTLFGVLASGKYVNGMDVYEAATCKQQLDACIASPTHAGTATSSQTISCDATDVIQTFASCDATIGEWEACFNASVSMVAKLVDSITCDSAASMSRPLKPYVSLPNITGLPTNVQSVPECQPLDAKCPNFLLQTEPPSD
jgi:hypothetical protein